MMAQEGPFMGVVNTPLMAIRNIVVCFGALRAVDNVSLDLLPGTTIGLIGPNGAGKTTFINAISGFVRTTGGSIRFCGDDISHLKPHQRARRGLARTFQNLELFGSMSVIENVMAHWEVGERFSYVWKRTSQKIVRDRAMALLQSLRLGAIAEYHVSELSYADRKLTEFARAIMANISLILLDEPAAGVSMEERRDLVDRIREHLVDHGIAALLVEHDMDVIRNLCTKVYVMDAGKIIAEGPPEEVMQDANVRRAYLG
jgi:ABC-type branched-subunit amino acid transport system ATPase component